ncbi:MAG: dTMP kinase [Steroidobacteraceae bacterium]
MAARFITLEGIEGCGKSTLARELTQRLTARGISVRPTREPGGTPLAEKLRDILLQRGSETLTPGAETLLMFGARAVHVENLIRPALACGHWVICDRFTDATRAYQGGGRGVEAHIIDSMAQLAHRDLAPDITLLLDLPAEQGLARAVSRGGPGDRFEDERLAFFQRVRNAYLAIAHAEPQRFRIIDASAPIVTVTERALEALLEGM